MTRRQVGVLVAGVILLVVAATTGLALRTTLTGPLLWTVALDGFPQSIVVDAQTHRAFVPTIPFGVGSASMNVLDTDTGAILRRLTIGGNWNPLPVVDERAGRVVVAASVQVRYGPGIAGIVRVLDARSGALVRAVTVGLFPQGVAVDEQTGRAFVTSPGFAGAGLVGVLDTRTGRLLRTVLAGLHPSPLMVDEQTGRAFVPTNVGVSVLDTRSGAVLRTVAVGQGRLAGLPLLDARSGRVFVVIRSLAQAPLPGSIIVLDARNGAVVRRVALGGSPGLVAVDERAGRVIVLTRGWPGTINHVSILDARTGAILHTLPVGVAAHAMAVDERNGHVFVINGPGFVILPDSWAWLPSWLRRRLPFLPPPGGHSRSVPAGVTMIDPTR